MREYSWLWLVAILVLGCSETGGRQFTDIPSAESSKSIAAGKSSGTNGSMDEGLSKVDLNRHVIYDADIDLLVDDFSVFSRQLPKLVFDCGGYVADVTINQQHSRRTGTWSVRIRSSKFDEFVMRLAEIGFPESHHQKARDVTAEFVDLEARVVNKKKMESRILALIGESNRGLKYVIGLEHELARIRGDVERMEGRLNLLKNQTEFATVTITALERQKAAEVVVEPFSKRVAGSWATSVELLTRCVQYVTVILVYLFPWLVLVSALLIPAYLYYSRRMRRVAGLQNS